MSRRSLSTLASLAVLVALGLWLAGRVPSTRVSATTPGAISARDLAVDEAAGGHTLERHVGRSDAELRRRLAAEGSLARASSFADRVTAGRAVAAAIAAERRRVDAWLGGRRSTNLVLHWRGDGTVVGRVLARGAAEPLPARGVRAVLRRRGGDFYVLPAYPELWP